MDPKAYLVTLELKHGRKFVGKNSYRGGKVEYFKDLDYSWFLLEDLQEIVKHLGLKIDGKYAFGDPNSVEKFFFFEDEYTFNVNIMHHIDYKKKNLRIYVEAENFEVANDNGVETELNSIGGSFDVNHINIIEHDIEHEGDNDDHFGAANNKSLELSESSDGMNDADFSSDDQEFVKARTEMINEKYKDVEVEKANFLLFETNSERQHEDHFGADNTGYDSSDNSFVTLDSFEEAEFIKYKKKGKSKLYAKNCDHKNLKFELGMRFRDVNECKEAVRSWAILNGHNIKWKKSGCGKLKAVCEGNCPWMLYASKVTREPTCVIKTYISEHTCVRAQRNRQANGDWLANVVMPVLKRNPNYSAKDIVRDVRLTYDTNVSLKLCYSAKSMALERLRGTYDEHYGLLRSYILELRKIDNEGKFELKTVLDRNDRCLFQRIYVGFSALRKGFEIGCRKAICFDACFLKTFLGGALVAAVAKDCNNKMYPISWAVVEKENEETWTWFFEKLFEDLQIDDGFGWTFMSDKQKGLINGIQKLAPNAEHRHCARHIYANWKKKFAGPKFKAMFWDIVKTASESQFHIKLTGLKDESTDAYENFIAQKPQSFCKSLVSKHTKTDLVDNNICESFNSYILKTRDLPLIDMLEDIRQHLMSRLYEIEKTLQASQDILCPNIRKKLSKIQELVKYCDLIPAVGGKYEVHCLDETHVVDLGKKECNCRWWELCGIPCCHAMACIFHSREDPVTYTDSFFYKFNGLRTYMHGLVPTHDRNEWPKPEPNEPSIFPPMIAKLPGRPKKNRKRDHHEEPKQTAKKMCMKGLIKMSCSKCGGFNHNKRSCKSEGSSIAPKPKEKRGRPRKHDISQPQRHMSRASSGRSNDKDMINAEQRDREMTRQQYGVRISLDSGNVFPQIPTTRRVQYVSGPRAAAAASAHIIAKQHEGIGGSKRTEVVENSSTPNAKD